MKAHSPLTAKCGVGGPGHTCRMPESDGKQSEKKCKIDRKWVLKFAPKLKTSHCENVGDRNDIWKEEKIFGS